MWTMWSSGGGELEDTECKAVRWEDLEGAGEPQLEQTDGGPGSGIGLRVGSWLIGSVRPGPKKS